MKLIALEILRDFYKPFYIQVESFKNFRNDVNKDNDLCRSRWKSTIIYKNWAKYELQKEIMFQGSKTTQPTKLKSQKKIPRWIDSSPSNFTKPKVAIK